MWWEGEVSGWGKFAVIDDYSSLQRKCPPRHSPLSTLSVLIPVMPCDSLPFPGFLRLHWAMCLMTGTIFYFFPMSSPYFGIMTGAASRLKPLQFSLWELVHLTVNEAIFLARMCQTMTCALLPCQKSLKPSRTFFSLQFFHDLASME